MISPRVTLVGRRRECLLLQQSMTAAARGQTQVVLLSGEPGIGKTRLLREAADEAGREGFAVLNGGSSEAEGMPPYLPFLEALGPYIRSVEPDILRADLGAHRATLAGIFPEIVTRLGEVPASYSLPPEQGRLRLFDAVGQFLAAVTRHAPLLLVLDDLHWADPASLDLLRYLPHHQPAARLLIAGAYREAEAAQNSALQRTLDDLTRRRQAATLTLRPLSATETGELARAHLGSPAPAALASLLHRQCEGNPFFAEELLADWIERGLLDSPRTDWTAAELPGAPPPSLTRAVQQRVARLSTVVVDHLRVAAIIGRSFDAALLAAVMDQDPETTEDRLLDAVRAGLLITAEPGVFAFRHDKVRECLSAEVSSTRRRRLHQRIGQALAAQPGSPDSRRLAELAFHFARSEDHAAGVDYSIQAAEQAVASHAPLEAMDHYRTALELLAAGDPRRGSLLLAVGHAALHAGREANAGQAFTEARDLLARQGDWVAAASAAHGLGIARWRQGALATAQLDFQAALALLAGHEGPETVHVLVALAGLLNAHLGLHADGLAAAERALALARRLDDRRLEGAAARMVGQLTAWGNQIPEGIRVLEDALVLATAAGDPAEAAEICGTLANLYFATLDVERSRQVTLTRMDCARQCQQPYELRHIHSWLAELALQQGNWTESEQLVAQAQEIVDRLTGDEPRAVLDRVRGRMAAYRGHHDEAVRCFSAATDAVRPQGPQHLLWYLGPLAQAHLALGHRDTALSLMHELEAATALLPAGSLPTAPALTALLELAVELDDLPRADIYARQLEPFAGRMFLSLVDLALAAHALARRHWPAAESSLSRAERDARRAGFRPLLQRTLRDRAALEQARGGSLAAARAAAALDEALALCTALGLDQDAAEIRRRLSALRPETSLPMGLSPREVEVLRLVAAGKSNRQIAEELYVSEKTVEKHVTGILTKTGSENRAAAAAFAIRHGLA